MRTIAARVDEHPTKFWILYLIAFLICGLSGCAGPVNYSPGTTTGQILVGSPKVSTRERLLNDRLEQETWLTAQLKAADQQEMGLQGITDVKSFVGMVTKAEVNIDPTQAKLYKKKQEVEQENANTNADLARLDHKIAVLKKERELKKLQDSSAGSDTGATNAPAADQSTATTTKTNDVANSTPADSKTGSPVPGSTPDSQLFSDVSKLKEKVDQLLPDPSRATTAAVRATPLDAFKDRLAYRTAIRSEIVENALDDRHDLAGNALVSLSFDATVVPQNNSSAWAMVEVCITHEARSLDDCFRSLRKSGETIARKDVIPLVKQCRSAYLKCTSSDNKTLHPWCSTDEDYKQNPLTLVVERLPGHGPESCEVKALREIRYTAYENPYKTFAESVDTHANDKLNDLLKRTRAVPNQNGTNALEKAGINMSGLLDVDRIELTRKAAHEAARKPNIVLKWMTAFFNVFNKRTDSQVPLLQPDEFVETLNALVKDAAVGSAYYNCRTIKPQEEQLRCAFDSLVVDYVIQQITANLADLPMATLYISADHTKKFIAVTRIGADDSAERRVALHEFADAVEKFGQLFVYAVTPKEATERISDVAARREVTEFVLQLSALLGNVGGAKAATDYVRANEAIFQALRRQPIVVGFSRMSEATVYPESVKAPPTFGWVLGPRYGISSDGTSAQFRHSVAQHAVSALVSLPSWWSGVNVVVKTYWLNENGSEIAPQSFAVYPVRLPTSSNGILEASLIGRQPSVDPKIRHFDLQSGQPATLLIPGPNLWRNTVVTLGAQKATRIEILPNMKGILAYFDQVVPRVASDGDVTLPVTVWTSQGESSAGSVTIKQPKQDVSISGTVAQTYLISKLWYEFDISAPLPRAPTSVLLAKTSAGAKTWVPSQQWFPVDQKRIRFLVPDVQGALADGDQVEMALEIKDRFDAQPRLVPLTGSPILYGVQPLVKAKATAETSGQFLPQHVELSFPPNVTIAFPSLKGRPIPITVEPTSDEAFVFRVLDTCNIDSNNKCTILVDVAPSDRNAFDKHAVTDSKPVRAILGINLDGRGLSVENNGSVDIKK